MECRGPTPPQEAGPGRPGAHVVGGGCHTPAPRLFIAATTPGWPGCVPSPCPAEQQPAASREPAQGRRPGLCPSLPGVQRFRPLTLAFCQGPRERMFCGSLFWEGPWPGSDGLVLETAPGCEMGTQAEALAQKDKGRCSLEDPRKHPREQEQEASPGRVATPSLCQRTGASSGSTVPHQGHCPSCVPSVQGEWQLTPWATPLRQAAARTRHACPRVGPASPRAGAVSCRGRDTALRAQLPSCLRQEFAGGVAGTSGTAAPASGPDTGPLPACRSQKAQREIPVCSREARKEKGAAV